MQVSKFPPVSLLTPEHCWGIVFVFSEGGIIPVISTRLTEDDKSDVPNVRAASGLIAKVRFPD